MIGFDDEFASGCLSCARCLSANVLLTNFFFQAYLMHNGVFT